MEKLLLKLARQLDSLDEASLMALWSKYATLVSRFEPTRRWEEACLVFSLIQAKHWKNQLFNYSWSQRKMPPLKNEKGQQPGNPLEFGLEQSGERNAPLEDRPGCRILSFKERENSEEDNYGD